MSKALSAASVVVSIGAVAGVVFASVQIGKIAGTLDRVETRLASLEEGDRRRPRS